MFHLALLRLLLFCFGVQDRRKCGQPERENVRNGNVKVFIETKMKYIMAMLHLCKSVATPSKNISGSAPNCSVDRAANVEAPLPAKGS